MAGAKEKEMGIMGINEMVRRITLLRVLGPRAYARIRDDVADWFFDQPAPERRRIELQELEFAADYAQLPGWKQSATMSYEKEVFHLRYFEWLGGAIPDRQWWKVACRARTILTIRKYLENEDVMMPSLRYRASGLI